MMGGGAGMMLHAKQTMEANRDLMKSKSIYERRNALDLPKTRTIYRFNESTPEMLQAIREFKLLENKVRARKQYILAGFCGILFVAAMWMILYY